MKRMCWILVLVLIVSFLSVTAYATEGKEENEYEKPILFRNAEWESPYDEVLKVLPDGVKMYGISGLDYWYKIEDRMYSESGDTYKAELGCYSSASSSSLKDAKVAGYEIAGLYLYFVYLPGEDGILVKDKDHTALIYAYYKLEPKDPDAVYADLVSKLTSLYGDVDLHQEKDPYISYEQNLWYGAEGTMVSLVREDYPSGNHYIYIKYGFSGADDLMESAYDAVVLEETLNAASNTDGL